MRIFKTVKKAKEYLEEEHGPGEVYTNDAGYTCRIPEALKLMWKGQAIRSSFWDWYQIRAK